ncbi:DUF2391 family protein [Sulfuricurvum sp.]|uniref:DUF2391 family protein n=1 Tax=Sulfuricurvum sp. TaxID=2025608 RepID=UPI0026234197|nr:DUF2391 family protein [Sulfuricurvum sp.]MDD2781358.1 DUF2391 family protein [Sulfuricurvum sp.]
MKLSINVEDLGQIALGAFMLAVPVSFSEEAWRMSETLPALNLLLVFMLSLLFLSIYAHYSVFQGNIENRTTVFFMRILIAYSITIVVVGLVLLSLNKLPMLEDPITAFKRLILIAMPASMGAIVVDGFDKE